MYKVLGKEKNDSSNSKGIRRTGEKETEEKKYDRENNESGQTRQNRPRVAARLSRNGVERGQDMKECWPL